VKPVSSSPWATSCQVEPSPRIDLPDQFNDDPFAERLLARRERMRARASTQLRRYWAGRRTSLDGPAQHERAFDSAARIVGGGPELPGYEHRLGLLADKLPVRRPSVSNPQANPDARLLCDTQGRPVLAFSPVRQAASARARGWMAAALDEALQADQELSLGIDRPVLHELPDLGMGLLTPARGAASVTALQRLALSRVFTNDWQARWQKAPDQAGGESWYLGGCAPFPERAARAEALTDMQHLRGVAPLFEVPQHAGSAWDAPLDPALAAKVQALDLDSLQWTMALERKNQCQDPVATPPSADAIRSSIASIQVVRTLIEEEPTLTLRQLLARFPHRLDVPKEHWADSHRDAAQQTEPAPESQRVDKAVQTSAPQPPRADPPQFISDADLSSWLRHYAPFNPFKRKDRTIAPLLRDAIGLRLKKDSDKRKPAAEKLRRSALNAVGTLSRRLEGLDNPDARRIAQARLDTVWHLITDTENRYGLAPVDLLSEPAKPAGRSWFPWRRRTQAQS